MATAPNASTTAAMMKTIPISFGGGGGGGGYNTTTPALKRHGLVVLDAEPWEMALLTATCASFAISYALVTVATYRVSRTLIPFILFLSEGVANVYTLTMATVCFAGQLLHIQLLGDQVTEYVIAAALAYVCHLHYLLIAVNRACAIFFPLYYDVWWGRNRLIASVVGLWLLGGSLELINLYQYFTLRATPFSFIIYVMIQRCVTLPSLCIYSAALGWVLIGRLRRLLEQRRRTKIIPSSSGCGTTTLPTFTPPTISSSNYAHVIDLRIFAYCFLSFLPNCYHIFVRPRPNSFHFLYYAIIRQWSPGLLLLVMSSPARAAMPNPLRRWAPQLLFCLPPPAAMAPASLQLRQQSNALYSPRYERHSQRSLQLAQHQNRGGGDGSNQLFPPAPPRHQLHRNSIPRAKSARPAAAAGLKVKGREEKGKY